MSPTVIGQPAPDFAEITRLIDSARQRAYQAVNTTLIELYWQVGAYLSDKIAAAEWGEGVVEQLAQHLARTQPGLKGFTRASLFRMRQFYETYRADEIVAPLVRQLPWTHNLIILSRSKHPEERAFYLKMAAQEKWSKRELERQFDTALFERVVLSPAKVPPLVTQIQCATTGRGKLSVVQRETQRIVPALLTLFVKPARHPRMAPQHYPKRPQQFHPQTSLERHPQIRPERHPRVLLSGIHPQPLDSRQNHAGMTMRRPCA